MTKKEKRTLSGQIGGICPAGFCNGGFGCNHKSPKPEKYVKIVIAISKKSKENIVLIEIL